MAQMMVRPSRMTVLKFLVIVAVILGISFGTTFVIAGCGADEIANSANNKCASHGGVQEIESNWRLVVCKDGLVVEE